MPVTVSLLTRTSMICPSWIAMKSGGNPGSVHPRDQAADPLCLVHRLLDCDPWRVAWGHPASPS